MESSAFAKVTKSPKDFFSVTPQVAEQSQWLCRLLGRRVRSGVDRLEAGLTCLGGGDRCSGLEAV